VVYPELGMEAIFKITVKDFPAFIIVDDKGNNFYEKIPAWPRPEEAGRGPGVHIPTPKFSCPPRSDARRVLGGHLRSLL
jgi:hypothetical protein